MLVPTQRKALWMLCYEGGAHGARAAVLPPTIVHQEEEENVPVVKAST